MGKYPHTRARSHSPFSKSEADYKNEELLIKYVSNFFTSRFGKNLNPTSYQSVTFLITVFCAHHVVLSLASSILQMLQNPQLLLKLLPEQSVKAKHPFIDK